MSQIKDARERAGISIDQLSKLVQMPVKTLEAFEEGTKSCPAYIENLIVQKIKQGNR